MVTRHLQIEMLQQQGNGGDLVGFLLGRLLPEHDPLPRRPGGDEMQGVAAFRLSWLRREVLPSMAMMSGSSSRSPLIQARKQALNNSGSNAANTSHNVSWLGMPLS